jgi:hypothetical protein
MIMVEFKILFPGCLYTCHGISLDLLGFFSGAFICLDGHIC